MQYKEFLIMTKSKFQLKGTSDENTKIEENSFHTNKKIEC